jgi:hypothetical protein
MNIDMRALCPCNYKKVANKIEEIGPKNALKLVPQTHGYPKIYFLEFVDELYYS